MLKLNYFISFLKKIYHFIKINKLGSFIFFAFIFIILLWIALPPNLTCPDGFYHTKMAILMKEQGVAKNFPWMYFTTYRENFVNQHFGYHLFLIPFLFLPSPKNLDAFSLEIEPLLKTKLATVILSSFVFLLIYWWLKKEKVKGAILYSLLPLFIWPFVVRITLTRAPSISVVLLFFGIYLIVKHKYFWLAILSFIYVWTYGAWPLILLATLTYVLSVSLKNVIESWTNLIQNSKFKIQNYSLRLKIFIITFIKQFLVKTNLVLILASILGSVFGLTINPYFPKTFGFHWFELIKIAVINYHAKIGVGAEWYPLEPFSLILVSLPILILWLVATAWFFVQIRNQSKTCWFFFAFSLFFLLYTFKARRNIEYFTPLAIIFSGLSLKSFWQSINWQKYFLKIKELFHAPYGLVNFILAIFLGTSVIFFIGYYFQAGFLKSYRSFRENSISMSYLQKASFWLRTNTLPGEIVYQSTWDIFPVLFYFNHQNYYLNGLDQTFFYEYNQELFKKWDKIWKGRLAINELASTIKNDFKSSYILIENSSWKTEKMLPLFKKSKDFEKVYEDIEAIIYKIK